MNNTCRTSVLDIGDEKVQEALPGDKKWCKSSPRTRRIRSCLCQTTACCQALKGRRKASHQDRFFPSGSTHPDHGLFPNERRNEESKNPIFAMWKEESVGRSTNIC